VWRKPLPSGAVFEKRDGRCRKERVQKDHTRLEHLNPGGKGAVRKSLAREDLYEPLPEGRVAMGA